MPEVGCQAGTSVTRRNRAQEAERLQAAAAASSAAPNGEAAAKAASEQALLAAAAARHNGQGTRRQGKRARAALFPRVIVADYVADYRATVPHAVSREDIVVEIGCCNGATTALLAKHCRLAVGIDTSSSELEKARQRYPEIPFIQQDGFDIGALIKLREKYPFTVIYLDVNGSRDVPAVTRLIAIYAGAKWSGGAGGVETIVIKNWRLSNLLRASMLSNDLVAAAGGRAGGNVVLAPVEELQGWMTEEKAAAAAAVTGGEGEGGGGGGGSGGSGELCVAAAAVGGVLAGLAIASSLQLGLGRR
eukprot:SAG22_NODE_800_length_7109_cov_47.259058_7_plen_304_part_00